MSALTAFYEYLIKDGNSKSSANDANDSDRD